MGNASVTSSASYNFSSGTVNLGSSWSNTPQPLQPWDPGYEQAMSGNDPLVNSSTPLYFNDLSISSLKSLDLSAFNNTSQVSTDNLPTIELGSIVDPVTIDSPELTSLSSPGLLDFSLPIPTPSPSSDGVDTSFHLMQDNSYRLPPMAPQITAVPQGLSSWHVQQGLIGATYDDAVNTLLNSHEDLTSRLLGGIVSVVSAPVAYLDKTANYIENIPYQTGVVYQDFSIAAKNAHDGDAGLYTLKGIHDAAVLTVGVTGLVEAGASGGASRSAGIDMVVPSTAVDATAEIGAGNGGIPSKLYHYTNEAGMKGILDSQTMKPSLKALNPNDVRYGNGQYLSDIAPGAKTPNQLSKIFLNLPFQGSRFTNFIEIDTTGLNVIQGRPGVYVVPNEIPLDLSGRITNSGTVLGQ